MIAQNLKTYVLAVITTTLLISMAAKTTFAADKEVVEYRLTKWKSAHFDQAKDADTHYETVKKLGCEVKKDSHVGHIDVSFFCPQWRRITLKNHDHAHQWEKWLKTYGFETRHTH